MNIRSSSLIKATFVVGIPVIFFLLVRISGWQPPKCEYDQQYERSQRGRAIRDSIDTENRKCPFKMEKNTVTGQWRVLYWLYGTSEPEGWVDPEKEGKWPFGNGGYATFDTYRQYLLKWSAITITRIPYGDSSMITHKLDSLKKSFFRKNLINNNWTSK